MSYRDILLLVDGAAETRIAVGRDIAGVFNAHLTGLHIVAFPFDEGHPWAHEISSDVLQSHADVTDALAEDARRCFTRTVGPIACTWQRQDGNPAAVMARAARGHDLVIVGQPARPERGGLSATTTERLVLAAGVPTLVIPNGDAMTPGRRIMVAWNGSREAARAVRDAIPFLQRAQAVILVEVPHGRRTSAISREDLGSLRIRLKHRGVPVEDAHTVRRAKNEGERLLTNAMDWEADLIVMGAYGRARISELVLGGVTRYMLTRAPIPLMMAH